MRRECRERSPRHQLFSDPDMHHGTCVTHVPWCISGSLTGGFLWSRWRGKRYRCHVSNALPWKLTPPSICNNQLYYKVTPRVIVLWLPSYFATTGLHCEMTPHFEMTPNKQYHTSYVKNNLWYCVIVFLSFMTKIHVSIAFRFWYPN